MASAYKYKLEYLKKKFETSLILNPTENVPFIYDMESTNFFTGLYVSERFKDVNDKVILQDEMNTSNFSIY